MLKQASKLFTFDLVTNFFLKNKSVPICFTPLSILTRDYEVKTINMFTFSITESFTLTLLVPIWILLFLPNNVTIKNLTYVRKTQRFWILNGIYILTMLVISWLTRVDETHSQVAITVFLVAM